MTENRPDLGVIRPVFAIFGFVGEFTDNALFFADIVVKYSEFI